MPRSGSQFTFPLAWSCPQLTRWAWARAPRTMSPSSPSSAPSSLARSTRGTPRWGGGYHTRWISRLLAAGEARAGSLGDTPRHHSTAEAHLRDDQARATHYMDTLLQTVQHYCAGTSTWPRCATWCGPRRGRLWPGTSSTCPPSGTPPSSSSASWWPPRPPSRWSSSNQTSGRIFCEESVLDYLITSILNSKRCFTFQFSTASFKHFCTATCLQWNMKQVTKSK